MPHLTLGKELYPSSIREGVGKPELEVMENQARRELAPYPRFDVTSIRVYELNTEKNNTNRSSTCRYTQAEKRRTSWKNSI